MKYTHWYYENNKWNIWLGVERSKSYGSDLAVMKKEADKYATFNGYPVRQVIKDSHKKTVYDVGPGSKPVKLPLIKKVPTLEELNAKIKADNAAFSKLPLYKQRVEIAKDVLKWISTEKLAPKMGTYFLINGDSYGNRYSKPDGSLQETLLGMSTDEKCDVCAKGAIFACTVARKNEVKNGFNISWDDGSSPKSISKVLGGVFSSAQLRLIEVEFERRDIEWVKGDRTKMRNIKPKMDMGGLGPTTRMVRIMKNIIKNKGWFKPELG